MPINETYRAKPFTQIHHTKKFAPSKYTDSIFVKLQRRFKEGRNTELNPSYQTKRHHSYKKYRSSHSYQTKKHHPYKGYGSSHTSQSKHTSPKTGESTYKKHQNSAYKGSQYSHHTKSQNAQAHKLAATTNIQSIENKVKTYEFLYRGDTRHPDIIFSEGFKPRGTHKDLLKHAKSTSTPGNFVSATTSEEVAIQFAKTAKDLKGNSGKGGFVYELRTSKGLDVNKILGNESPFASEKEIAVLGGIAPKDIYGGQRIGTNGQKIGHLIKNVHFVNPSFS